MHKLAIVALASIAALAATSGKAHENTADYNAEIRDAPIAGLYNAPWFNYLADINEAEKELGNDLEGAGDAEDRSDAWEEYHTEIVDADKDYVQEMRERGYRAGRVTVG